MLRREFLGVALSAAISSAVTGGDKRRPVRILLRSSWQVVNIGDIAHTPGVLALLENYLPEAEVILWASGDLSDEVAAMEHKRFPKLKIVKGSIGANGNASKPELQEALDWCDFLLHGSGPSLVAEKDVAAFVKHRQKPFGVYGITYGGGSAATQDLLSQAKFVYFRDSVSLAKAQSEGISCPILEFAPDGAFACDLRDDAGAEKFLEQNGLEPGKFVCCIPRLRYTPYWLIKEGRALDPVKQARNEEMGEHDHAPLREAITAVVKETGKKVLLCPEDMTQMRVGRELLLDKLPEAVKRQVVWRENFWLTDMALSTYVRSSGLFGLEMHSPIMCVGNGIPAIVCRFEEQTSKGYMWRDIGLGDWLFNADVPEEMSRFTSTVLDMVTKPDQTQSRLSKAREFVEARQRDTMGVLKGFVEA